MPTKVSGEKRSSTLWYDVPNVQAPFCRCSDAKGNPRIEHLYMVKSASGRAAKGVGCLALGGLVRLCTLWRQRL